MSGDYSRRRFDPTKHYASVLMQQGRVQLDADWNEMAELFERRFRAERVDTFGRVAVPRVGPADADNTPAFRLTFKKRQDSDPAPVLHIGPGRMYVDGLLVENHGRATPDFDPVLDEPRGVDLPLTEQPYFPPGTPLPAPNRPFAVYLDVWRREVTALEDPSLVEPALGVDTTTRTQVAWQARFFDPGTLTPQTRAADIENSDAWKLLTRPSGARLTVTVTPPVEGPDDPCILPPDGGFRSLENHFYRVEIHRGGPQGQATFKWSRDNASVATGVVGIDRDTLTVQSLGRDAVLRIRTGDWVEITDDLLEAARVPGVMARVRDTDDEERTIVLDAPLSDLVTARPDIVALGGFPNLADAAARHTRVRRWDQGGQVVDIDGNPIPALSPDNNGGVIPVPAPGSFVVLENGIRVAFDTEGGADYRPFDYWTFAARAADGSVDELVKAPPAGDHHHYALLGLVDAANQSVSDLRVLWPPIGDDTGGCCTIHLTAAQHNSGRTIQQALDELRTAGGGVLCLDAGVYRLVDDALRLDGARNITIRGQGPQTILARQVLAKPAPAPAPEPANPDANVEQPANPDANVEQPANPDANADANVDANPPADSEPPQQDFRALFAEALSQSVLLVGRSAGITLQDLTLLGSGELREFGPVVPLMRVSTCAGLRIERCTFISTGTTLGGPGLMLRGILADAAIRENTFFTGSGIILEYETIDPEMLTADFRVEDNLFQCAIGIAIDEDWYYTRTARIARNRFVGRSGLKLAGIAADTVLEIADNILDVDGVGIDLAVSDAAITGNTLRGVQLRPPEPPNLPLPPAEARDNVAIRVDDGQTPSAPHTLVIAGNTISHFNVGVELQHARYERVEVRGNTLHDLREHAIFLGAFENTTFNRASLGEVVVTDNTIRDIGGQGDPSYLVGIGVHFALAARVENNTIERFGVTTPRGRPWASDAVLRAISVVNCMDTYVRGNRLFDCGPLVVAPRPAQGDGAPPPIVVLATALHFSLILQRLECTQNHVARRDYRGVRVPLSALHTDLDAEKAQRIVLTADEDRRFWAFFPDQLVALVSDLSYRIAGNHLQGVLREDGSGVPADHLPVSIACRGVLHVDGNHVTIHAPARASDEIVARIDGRSLLQMTANAWIENRDRSINKDVKSSLDIDAINFIALGNTFTRMGVRGVTLPAGGQNLLDVATFAPHTVF